MNNLRWEIDGILMRSSRPGYDSKMVSKTQVDQWIAEVKLAGVRTIICLLDDEQLAYYSTLPHGLLGYYEEAGFNVVHIRIPDPAHHEEEGNKVLKKKLPDVYNAFLAAPKPVLIGLERRS